MTFIPLNRRAIVSLLVAFVAAVVAGLLVSLITDNEFVFGAVFIPVLIGTGWFMGLVVLRDWE